jgi:putative photosynthetic complex assembly protein 2
MVEALFPIGFAIFVWWFSTGIVLLLDGLPRTTFRWSHIISSLLAIGAMGGLVHTAAQTTRAGAYCAFTCALLVWGWHELSFLTGWVTGPRREPETPGAGLWLRFREALQTILWHELAILASGVLIAAITWDQPNRTGLGTFAVLWFMRISAKLNIFLGVRNLSVELLPSPLKYLGSYFRQRVMNLLFPFVVTAATALAVLVVDAALTAPEASPAATGAWLVATMLVMGILEHWLLVLPLEATVLWRWALRERPVPPVPLPGTSTTAVGSLEPTPVSVSAVPPHEQLLHAR